MHVYTSPRFLGFCSGWPVLYNILCPIMIRTHAWVFKMTIQDRFSVLLLAKNKRFILAGNENALKNDSKNIM